VSKIGKWSEWGQSVTLNDTRECLMLGETRAESTTLRPPFAALMNVKSPSVSPGELPLQIWRFSSAARERRFLPFEFIVSSWLCRGSTGSELQGPVLALKSPITIVCVMEEVKVDNLRKKSAVCCCVWVVGGV